MHPTRRFFTALLFSAAAAAVSAQAPAPVPAGQMDSALLEGQRLFAALDYERAVPALDLAIAQLTTRAAQNPAARGALAMGYELRARARFGLGDTEGAKSDLLSALKAEPGHVVGAQVSPRVLELFNEVRNQTVGTVKLTVMPADAELNLDDAPFAGSASPVPLLAGDHTITAKKAGYRRAVQPFTVAAGAASEVPLTLERVSATVAIVTVPPAVDVIVDGVPRGATSPGALAPEYAEWPARLGVDASAVSKPLVLEDLQPGVHLVELRRDCHVKVERRVEIKEPSDVRLDPVKLERAVAFVHVDSPREGSVVYLDGQPRGAVPLSLDDVCEGAHTVELRSPYGRYVRRIDAHPGDKIDLQGAVRPSFAVLSTSGLPEGLRGGADLRLAIERGLDRAPSVAFFAPPVEQVTQALQTERLSPGWLSFDPVRRPIGDVAQNLTSSARRDLSARLSRVLDAQGIAEITVPAGGERNQVFLTFLAAGSGEPDVLDVRIDDQASLASAAAMLEPMPPLLRPSVGLTAVDVLDVTGAVVIGIDAGGPAAKSGLAPGDTILRVNGQAVADATQFAAMLASKKADDQLQVDAVDRAGAAKRAALRVAAVPHAVAMADQTQMFNKLIAEIRFRLAGTNTPLEDSVLRLNLGVALMRGGDWSGALAELQRAKLPDGPGVSNGTAQYLMGLCEDALGQPANAERDWRAAAAADQSLLTEDGPSIKDLADQKLAELQRRGR
jgi:hypothetical protein